MEVQERRRAHQQARQTANHANSQGGSLGSLAINLDPEIRKFGSDTSDFASAVLCHCCWFNDRRKKGDRFGWRVFGDGKAVKWRWHSHRRAVPTSLPSCHHCTGPYTCTSIRTIRRPLAARRWLDGSTCGSSSAGCHAAYGRTRSGSVASAIHPSATPRIASCRVAASPILIPT